MYNDDDDADFCSFMHFSS